MLWLPLDFDLFTIFLISIVTTTLSFYLSLFIFSYFTQMLKMFYFSLLFLFLFGIITYFYYTQNMLNNDCTLFINDYKTMLYDYFFDFMKNKIKNYIIN